MRVSRLPLLTPASALLAALALALAWAVALPRTASAATLGGVSNAAEFQAALDAAAPLLETEDVTIELDSDFTVTSSSSPVTAELWDAEHTLTIDGNGREIEVLDDDEDDTLYISSAADLVIMDLGLTGYVESYPVAFVSDAALTVTDLTLEAASAEDTDLFLELSGDTVTTTGLSAFLSIGGDGGLIGVNAPSGGSMTDTDISYSQNFGYESFELLVVSTDGEFLIDGFVGEGNANDGYGVIYLTSLDGFEGGPFPSVFVAEEELQDEANELGPTGRVVIRNATFTDNESGIGSAVYAELPLTVENSVFESNGTYSGDAAALAFYGFASSERDLTITDSTFTQNWTASSAGDDEFDELDEEGFFGGAGAVWIDEGNAVISGSLFEDNYTDATGGAIVATAEEAPSTLSVVNSTFLGNYAETAGGAILVAGPITAEIEFSTLIDNEAGEAAGAVGLTPPFYFSPDDLEEGDADDYAPLATFFASVIVGDVPQCDLLLGEFVSNDLNYVSDEDCLGSGDAPSDVVGDEPMLGSLADNGGPTMTMMPLTGSPLIDAIPFDESDLLVDQRGEARPMGTGYDIGAVESAGDAPAYGVAFVVPTPEGDVLGYATCAVDAIEIGNTPASGLSGTPGSVSAVLGGLSFTIELAPGCDATDITLELPRPVNSVFKVDGSTWTDMSDTLSADGLTVEYTAVDGGAFDEDGTADGWIVDPVVPALDVSFTG